MGHLWLVLGVLAVWLLAGAGMYWGWKNRGRRQRQVVGELPPLPAELGAELLPALYGVYLGSTMAPNWQERVAVANLGFRYAGTARGFARGVLVERGGAEDIWIPVEAIVDIRTDSRLAGKVIPRGGLLVIRWELTRPQDDGGTLIDSGFRGDDKTLYEQWTTWQRGGSGKAD